MKIKIRRRHVVIFFLSLIGVLSIFVYHSRTLHIMRVSEEVGKNPLLDEFYYYRYGEIVRGDSIP